MLFPSPPIASSYCVSRVTLLRSSLINMSAGTIFQDSYCCRLPATGQQAASDSSQTKDAFSLALPFLQASTLKICWLFSAWYTGAQGLISETGSSCFSFFLEEARVEGGGRWKFVEVAWFNEDYSRDVRLFSAAVACRFSICAYSQHHAIISCHKL